MRGIASCAPEQQKGGICRLPNRNVGANYAAAERRRGSSVVAGAVCAITCSRMAAASLNCVQPSCSTLARNDFVASSSNDDTFSSSACILSPESDRCSPDVGVDRQSLCL